MVSFDGQWVYYIQLYDLRKANQWSPPRQGADTLSQGVWELKLAKPIQALQSGQLMVQVKDRQGNMNRIDRTFSVGGSALSASTR